MNKVVLDKLLRKILLKTESHCFTCGKYGDLEVGHFVPRRYLATRWDLRNCHLQCIECNRFSGGNLKKYREKLGRDLADLLWKTARSTPKTCMKKVYDSLKKVYNSVYEKDI